MEKVAFKNQEHYNDPTPFHEIRNAESYIYNPVTFCEHIRRRLGDSLKARFDIYFDEDNLVIEIQNFEFIFETSFKGIKPELGSNFLAHYVISETIKRYRAYVNKMFFRKKDLYF